MDTPRKTNMTVGNQPVLEMYLSKIISIVSYDGDFTLPSELERDVYTIL